MVGESSAVVVQLHKHILLRSDSTKLQLCATIRPSSASFLQCYKEASRMHTMDSAEWISLDMFGAPCRPDLSVLQESCRLWLVSAGANNLTVQSVREPGMSWR